MDLSLVFLGTGGSVPTARRATACLLLRRGGDRVMFDCGEGAQRQMHRSTGLVQLDEIYVTHYHADHYLGLPGLLRTYQLQDRERPLVIYGPPGLKDLFGAIRRIVGRPSYGLELVELEAHEAVRRDGYEIRAFPVDHRVRAYGYALVEDDRPGRFDPEGAAKLGVEPGPDFGRLQRGEEVRGAGGAVKPEDVMGETRAGRRVVISGDSAPCEETTAISMDADLLVHDGSFATEEADRAAETGHSTARDAAILARDAGVKLLALVHASSRYNVSDLLAEAREVVPNAIAPRDFDLVEVPFPERGEPELVHRGALDRGPHRESAREPS
ncbi:MAG: ribonuclease Z [Solirubrobacterales bacterium]